MLLEKARQSKNSDFKSALDAKAAELEAKDSAKHEGGSLDAELPSALLRY